MVAIVATMCFVGDEQKGWPFTCDSIGTLGFLDLEFSVVRGQYDPVSACAYATRVFIPGFDDVYPA
jgi:hypothetical protein